MCLIFIRGSRNGKINLDKAKVMQYLTIDNAESVDINYKEAIMPETIKEELGIKETQELVGALLDLGGALVNQSADGKISFGEILLNFPKVGKIIEEGKDFDEIMAEVKDLDEQEVRALNEDLITLVFMIVSIINNLKKE
jgi:hypothetical protein